MQAELKVIDDWATAAAILDPTRQRVLERLVAADSASGVARELGLPRQRVGYHVRELERHGLLEPVDERRRGNCIERVLQATARRYVISPAALGALGLSARDAQDNVSSNHVIAVAAQTIRDVSALRERSRAAGKQLPTMTIQLDMHFASAAARSAFADELTQFLAQAARTHHRPDAVEGRTYRFQVTGYPAPAHEPEADHAGGQS